MWTRTISSNTFHKVTDLANEKQPYHCSSKLVIISIKKCVVPCKCPAALLFGKSKIRMMIDTSRTCCSIVWPTLNGRFEMFVTSSLNYGHASSEINWINCPYINICQRTITLFRINSYFLIKYFVFIKLYSR